MEKGTYDRVPHVICVEEREMKWGGRDLFEEFLKLMHVEMTREDLKPVIGHGHDYCVVGHVDHTYPTIPVRDAHGTMTTALKLLHPIITIFRKKPHGIILQFGINFMPIYLNCFVPELCSIVVESLLMKVMGPGSSLIT